ncbi:hypothetical protein R6Q57_008909 [Mikania cordata]
MISKRFLLIALAFAIALLITSEIVAARELASNNENALEDAKHDYDKDDHDKHDHDKDDHDDDYYDHDRNHNHGKDDHYDHADDWHDHADDDDDDYYDHDRDHNHYDHGDHYDHRDHDWDDHDHGYNGWGHRRRFCRYGCCGHKDDYYRGCRCCATLEEAITYKQAYESQTHN